MARWDGLKLKGLNGFVSYKHAAFGFTGCELMDWSGVDYWDVFIDSFWRHPFTGWAKDWMLHLSKFVPMKKQAHLHQHIFSYFFYQHVKCSARGLLATKCLKNSNQTHCFHNFSTWYLVKTVLHAGELMHCFSLQPIATVTDNFLLIHWGFV